MHSGNLFSLILCLNVGTTEFKAINWLPTKNRMDQCVCVNVMRFFNGTAPAYSAEIFHPANLGRITRRSKFKLEFPLRKSTAGQKCLSYLGRKYGIVWNHLSCHKIKIFLDLMFGPRLAGPRPFGP